MEINKIYKHLQILLRSRVEKVNCSWRSGKETHWIEWKKIFVKYIRISKNKNKIIPTVKYKMAWRETCTQKNRKVGKRGNNIIEFASFSPSFFFSHIQFYFSLFHTHSHTFSFISLPPIQILISCWGEKRHVWEFIHINICI